MPESTSHSLLKNLGLHAIIEKEISETPWGTLTFNVGLYKGIAKLETLNIVKNKRTRYTG